MIFRILSGILSASAIFFASVTIQVCAHEANKKLSIEVVVGTDEHPVVDWKSERCEAIDIPDTSLRAYRFDNKVYGFSTHYINRRLSGPSLKKIKRNCDVVFEGGGHANPALNDDKIWISSTWALENGNIFALGHNEFQGNLHQGACKFGKYLPCWYNTIVPLLSIDGGATFVRDERRVAVAVPYVPYDIGQGHPRGFFNPSNMISFNKHIYFFAKVSGFGSQASGVCIFRTDEHHFGESWEVLSVDGWEIIRGREGIVENDCRVLKNLNSTYSIVYYRDAEIFIGIFPFENGIGFSTSRNLIEWEYPKKFSDIPVGPNVDKCSGVSYAYPTLLDSSAKSKNFEDVGSDPQLFLVKTYRVGCRASLQRDLIRFDVKIERR